MIIRYTTDDMKVLHKLSEAGSIPEAYLPELKYSPTKFKALLESYGLKRDVHYLFEMPLREVGLLINRGELSGYLRFRLQVKK